MRAGTLRHRVTLQCRAPGGALGQPSNTWKDVATVAANIRYGSGSEAIRSGQVASLAKVSIRIRWRTDVNASMRVLCNGVAYNIVNVMPDMQRRVHVDLVCEVPT